jgi:hypothetical protein
MDDFVNNVPRMPLVLQPHDVYHEDWIRFMHDIALVWSGRMPIPELSRGGRTPKRATLAADLVDTWNKSFFVARGVEVVLYKGQERRSGADAGMIDRQIPVLDASDSFSSSSSESSSEDSDLSGDERYGQGGHGMYGRQGHGHGDSDARRRRHEQKDEKRRRAKEKKLRRKAKERQKTYGLYLKCVPRGTVGHGNIILGTGHSAGGYGGMGPAGGAGGATGGMPLRSTSPMPGMGPKGGRVSPIPMSAGHHAGGGYGGGGYGASPIPGYSGIAGGRSGRTSPMPAYSVPVGGRTSPMPGYPGPAAVGRASPMPGYPSGGRISPMPGYPSGIGGRTSPMPGGYAGGRASPMPGGY